METAQNTPRKPRIIIFTAIAFAVLILGGVAYGLLMLRQSQQPVTSVEVEQTATTGDGVIVGEDAEASGGKYIQFEPKQ